MKRETVVNYFGVICTSLIIMLVISVFTVIDHVIKCDNNSSHPVSVSPISKLTVIIDAGHGGEDGGAVGVNGAIEKDLNLAIAQKVYNLFLLTDINVVMTRTDDKMLYEPGQEHSKKKYDINNRIKFADLYPESVFVSIHQNKFPIEKYSGLQVYYSKNNEDSVVLAETIQNKVITYLQNDNNRKIKPAGRNILLLHKLHCSAVLVECGFLSNYNEEIMLCDDEYQNKLAFLIFSSIVESNIKTNDI